MASNGAMTMGDLTSFHPARSAFLAGLVGALVMLAVMLAFRLATGVPMLPELLETSAISRIPAPLFASLLGLFGNLAKPAFSYLLILLQIPIGGLLGLALVYWWRRPSPQNLRQGRTWVSAAQVWRQGWFGAATFGLLLWLLTGLIVLPVGGNGLFGTEQSAPVGLILMSLAAAQLTFSLLTHAVYWALEAPTLLGLDPASGFSPARRRNLQWIGVGGLALVSAGLSARLLIDLSRLSTVTQAITRGLGFLPPEITPNDDFYVISKNFIDPTVPAEGWTLQVEGLVDGPYSIGYDELKTLPAVEMILTLECISNPVGGNLISNAQWRGVRLLDLLERAGVRRGAVDLALYAADDYSDSIRIEKALHPETTLVYEMNGEPLPQRHGFPARLLVPGIHGEKNVKWLHRMEVVDYDFKGFWQKQGWSDSAEIHTMSRIDVPKSREAVPGDSAFFGGIAFAGDRGISKVEISFDLGRTWREALVKPPLSPFTWVLWTYTWDSPPPGEYSALSRAFDGTGEVQVQTEADIYPDGATGYHLVGFRVLPV